MDQVEWCVKTTAFKVKETKVTIQKAADPLSCGLDSMLDVLKATLDTKGNLEALILQREQDQNLIDELRVEVNQLKKKL
jgi:hypothetical protein